MLPDFRARVGTPHSWASPRQWLKLRQHLMRRTYHVSGKIDLDPGGSGHVGDFKDLAALAQQIAHRFLMRHMRTVSRDIARHQRREPARTRLVEAEESDRLADRVVFQVRRQLLAQFDRHAAAY